MSADSGIGAGGAGLATREANGFSAFHVEATKSNRRDGSASGSRVTCAAPRATTGTNRRRSGRRCLVASPSSSAASGR